MIRRNIFSGLAAAIGLGVAGIKAESAEKTYTLEEAMALENRVHDIEVKMLIGRIEQLEDEGKRRREELIKDVQYFADKANKARERARFWRNRYDVLRG